MARITASFGALVAAQAAHSVEEYIGRLWESFPPARFFTSLISSDPELGFIVINITFVAFGVWCVAWPIRLRRRSAASLAWLWVVIEMINGIGHPAWSVREGGYTPGLLTAPFLLLLSLYLAFRLRDDARSSSYVA
jgi:hypothetical protein